MQELETMSVAILKKMSRGKRSFKTFLDYVKICSNSSKIIYLSKGNCSCGVYKEKGNEITFFRET